MVGRPPRFHPYEVNVWVKEGKNGQLVKFSKKELILVWTPSIACCRDTPLAANKNMKQQQQMQHSLQRCNTGCSNNESRDVALVAQSGYRLHSLVPNRDTEMGSKTNTGGRDRTLGGGQRHSVGQIYSIG